MALPDQTPKLPKWPFLLGDAALLGAAWLIAERAPRPLAGDAVAAVLASAAAAALVGVLPFLSDYARRQDEALDERQRSLEALSRTVATAAEQIGIAAGGFQEIAELAQKNLKLAELLSDRFREEIPTLQGRLDELDARIAMLKSAAARFSAPPPPRPARHAPVEPEPPAPDPAAQAPSAAPPTLERDDVPAASEPAPSHPGPAPAPVSADPSAEEPAAVAPTPVEPPAPRPPVRKRPSRKAVEAPEPALPLALEPAPVETDFSQIASEDAAEPAVSADGATRLLVTAYIGIGNRLFIRGDGPGLNWSKGVPLQFVSIGKWSWETAEAAAPVSFKLYKNDELECAAVGLRRLDPGRQQEITAAF